MTEGTPKNAPNPGDVHVWLIGTSVASLSAAVFLIHDTNFPGPRIHILDVKTRTDRISSDLGDWETGYTLNIDFLPFLLEPCTAALLSHIPGTTKGSGSLLDEIIHTESEKVLFGYERPGLAIQDPSGIRIARHPGTHVRAQDRKNIIQIMLEDERGLEAETIEKKFSESFFMSDLWRLFSVKYCLQPWHSAIEFHRHLCKYIDYAQRAVIRVPAQAQYTTTHAIIQPILRHLTDQGVDFRTGLCVSNLKMLPEDDPQYVSEIQCTRNGQQSAIPVTPHDMVIATLGSTTSGVRSGSDVQPPPPISSIAETIMDGYWSLWFRLAKQSPKFGCPAAFCTHIPHSKMASFTTTLRGDEGKNFYISLRNKTANRSLLIMPGSNWSACLCLPSQPVIPAQPVDVIVIWGYALTPERQGNFTRKPLSSCNGVEVFWELLSHLGFQSHLLLLSTLTVPQLLPLATSALSVRDQGNRPYVIPARTRNLGLIGQFCEIADEACSGMEYSVRSAQVAVHSLIETRVQIPEVKRNIVAEKYGHRA